MTKPSLPFAALTGVIASLSVFAIAQGLSYPLFTFMMQRQGMTPAEIGLSAAMTPLGLIASAFFVPAAVRLVGARGLATVCALSASALLTLVGLLQNDIAWYPVRFLIGVAINPLYILGEVWTLALAPPERRGRIMGVFNAVTGIGYAAGPLTLAFVGSEGWPPLLVGIAAFAACAGLLFATTAGLRGFEDDGAPKGSVLGFWLVAPTLLLAVVVSAATQQSVYSLLPVFGAAYGLPEATLAGLITAMSAGNILLQLPLGVMAEKFGARRMIVACALVNSSCALLLPALVTTPLSWPVVLAMGGVGYGVYTMALVELGNRFRGSVLVTGNAAFALMWGAGGIVGPPGSGLAMQAAGPVGMPVLLATLGFGLVSFAVLRSLSRR
ncbi:MAG: MFS transporter [Rhizobiaceae bacterium]|nr:MAG: MFS transporter [Rhizobiaceae bacterium]CAG0950359.1 putative MFS-type transporter YcaD [Rhizobiaceae bacterium]